MRKTLTKAEFMERANAVHGEGRFDYSDSNYEGMRKPIQIFCNSHQTLFSLTAAERHIAQSQGCQACALEGFLSKRRDRAHKYWLKKALQKHGDRFDYSESIFLGALKPIDITCREHGKAFTVDQAKMHLRHERGCNQCKEEARSKGAALRGSKWEQSVHENQPNHFDLSRVVYVNEDTPVEISCNRNPSTSAFAIAPYQVLQANKGGCPYCGPVRTTDEFIRRCTEIHGTSLDFSHAEFVHQEGYVEVYCPVHKHRFSARAHNLLLGHGCSRCGNDRVAEFRAMTTEEFRLAACEVHGDRYSYDRTVCRGRSEELEIGCPVHGYVSITANQHLIGCGCNVCGEVIGRLSIGRENWCDHVEIAERMATLYYVRFLNSHGGEFFKIGFTSNSINVRFRGFLGHLDLIEIETIAQWKAPLVAVVSIEQEVLREYDAVRVQEKVVRNGNTEVFAIDVLGLTGSNHATMHKQIVERLRNVYVRWRESADSFRKLGRWDGGSP